MLLQWITWRQAQVKSASPGAHPVTFGELFSYTEAAISGTEMEKKELALFLEIRHNFIKVALASGGFQKQAMIKSSSQRLLCCLVLQSAQIHTCRDCLGRKY